MRLKINIFFHFFRSISHNIFLWTSGPNSVFAFITNMKGTPSSHKMWNLVIEPRIIDKVVTRYINYISHS